MYKYFEVFGVKYLSLHSQLLQNQLFLLHVQRFLIIKHNSIWLTWPAMYEILPSVWWTQHQRTCYMDWCSTTNVDSYWNLTRSLPGITHRKLIQTIPIKNHLISQVLYIYLQLHAHPSQLFTNAMKYLIIFSKPWDRLGSNFVKKQTQTM